MLNSKHLGCTYRLIYLNWREKKQQSFSSVNFFNQCERKTHVLHVHKNKCPVKPVTSTTTSA